MNHAMSMPEPHDRRRRHRSPQRKIVESLGLILGVPALLFLVLALSVEVIEYRPSDNLISNTPGSATPSGAAGMRTSGRMPASVVVEIPPIGVEQGQGLE